MSFAVFAEQRGIGQYAVAANANDEDRILVLVPFKPDLAIRLGGNLRLGQRDRDQGQQLTCFQICVEAYGVCFITVPVWL